MSKARGMTQIAKEAGIEREALYKALRQDSAPRFDTINRVVNAL
ncbi:putative addiction module antidote protein, partial [Acinetobacter junii]